jgi:3'-phosphoadenosine 5'-phosphosulfate (PAPS) 3'-phosphatase
VLIDNTPEPRGATQVVFERLRCTGYVESGSISLKICRIADGTADVFVKDITVRDWDIAPAHLVIGEAGGVLQGLHGAAEIAYSGSYERGGIVAAASAELLAEARAALVSNAT